MVGKARVIGLFLCPNDEKTRFKTIDENAHDMGFEPMQIEAFQIFKANLRKHSWICLFPYIELFAFYKDRFVRYHECGTG